MSAFVCFGEVLWDVFPNEKKIGGAPLNVALRLASFQNNVSMISAVGNDELGKPILNFCQENGIKTDAIQVLEDYKTGEVAVALNKKGSATYEILHPKAWDKIAYEEKQIQIVKNADVFVFGSLVARDIVSKETLKTLLNYANYKVFDVNLRPPFYTLELLMEFMKIADFIKFNDEELYEISKKIGSPFNNLEQHIFYISEQTKTKTICVTKGEHGAVLLFQNQLYYNSGYQIAVADTVGSGDSFLGTLIHHLQDSKNPQRAIDYACAVGALVATKKGANPPISVEEIKAFIQM